MKSLRNPYLALILIVIAVLLLAAASLKSFWEDETFSARVAQESLVDIPRVTTADVHPPLSYYLMAIWGSLLGYQEVALRLPSVVFSLCTILLTYWLADNLLGRRTATVAIILMGLSPIFIMFGHNARYYPLSAALAVLATLSMHQHRESGKWLYLGVYAVSSLALLYTVYSGVAIILSCNLWWIFQWLRDRHRSPFQLFLWVLAQAVVVFFFLPGWPSMTSVVERHFSPVLGNYLFIEVIKRLSYIGFVFSVGQTVSPLNPIAWIGLAVVIMIASYAIYANYSRIHFWLPIVFILVSILLYVFVSFISAWLSTVWQNVAHSMFFILPFIAIWLGAGIASMKLKIAGVSIFILLFVFCIGIINYFTNREFLQTNYAVDWRTIFGEIRSTAKPDALVLCDGNDAACGYYAERYGFGQHNPSRWEQYIQEGHSELWWIRVNLGRGSSTEDHQMQILNALAKSYGQTMIFPFTPQDPSVRWLKSKFMKIDDYEYRVMVYRFFGP